MGGGGGGARRENRLRHLSKSPLLAHDSDNCSARLRLTSRCPHLQLAPLLRTHLPSSRWPHPGARATVLSEPAPQLHILSSPLLVLGPVPTRVSVGGRERGFWKGRWADSKDLIALAGLLPQEDFSLPLPYSTLAQPSTSQSATSCSSRVELDLCPLSQVFDQLFLACLI